MAKVRLLRLCERGGAMLSLKEDLHPLRLSIQARKLGARGR